ncbi:hypothetical protein BpHYR1_029023 [Brachionus plicatilis]|uniref:Uncharacterized protein n=1 Tax=Brachionus plicatilis TaxID=10195 RepID=A0A3M7SWF4_BRAPC|nr:hypothetical protein BpHYR1_029023 [Brachionus plicatilis]
MVSMVLVPYGINPNFDIVPRVMVTSLRSSETIIIRECCVQIQKKIGPLGLVLLNKRLFFND